MGDSSAPGDDSTQGLVVEARVLTGDEEIDSGAVVVGADGRVRAVGPASSITRPAGARVLGGDGLTALPGIVDAHVHLAFGPASEALAGGVTAVRDLGAPPADAWRWRDVGPDAAPLVAVAGPLHTAPGGYPSRGWGAAGFAAFVADPAEARRAVAALAGSVDLVKLALEPAGGPVPEQRTAEALVEAAHGHGLAVTAHALGAAMVERALAAGVDELCHVPLERLRAATVDRIVAGGVPVVSTLQCHLGDGGPDLLANARDLVSAGATLAYGTDLGNTGTRTGVDPRELALLADAGLGPDGALAAATTVAAGLAGLRGRVSGRIRMGETARFVVVRGDPREDPATLRRPLAVVVGPRVLVADAELGGWSA